MLDTITADARSDPSQNSRAAATAHKSGSKGALWFFLLVLILAAGGGAAWWWFGGGRPQQAAAAAPPPMKVPVMTVMPRTVPIYRSFPAATEAVKTVSIQARVTGYLVERGAEDGADVAQGALLYKIDPSDYQAALDQARGQNDRSIASLNYSRANQGRNQTLVGQGWVSRDAFDQTNSTFRQGEASVATDKAAVETAALNLARAEIRAPFAGRISRSQVFEGSLIAVAGTTLNTLVQLDPIYVSFNPAEANLEAIVREQAKAPIETAVAAGGGEPSHTGTLTFLDNQVDRQTGTILARATIANTERSLLPGQFVTARLHLGDKTGALLVPQSAILTSQIGQTLMIAGEGGKAEQRSVKLGDVYDDMVVVMSGVKQGDRVITGQIQKLKPGMQVQPE